ncbi:MAG: hypothetical protein JO311_04845 [Candidatus Eremiobacteraeota bacterium]|nr:hypothetical protein [Candidatus Eremiobacteraeota bacterium]MBV9263160.1 hypothetical protein [Candidatus Eremiobacteraeota bacterium]
MELNDTLRFEDESGATLEFSVVGILEDAEDGSSYAVLVREATDTSEGQFIVTNRDGKLVEDDELVQEVLDEFFDFAEESAKNNGEMH